MKKSFLIMFIFVMFILLIRFANASWNEYCYFFRGYYYYNLTLQYQIGMNYNLHCNNYYQNMYQTYNQYNFINIDTNLFTFQYYDCINNNSFHFQYFYVFNR